MSKERGAAMVGSVDEGNPGINYFEGEMKEVGKGETVETSADTGGRLSLFWAHQS